jgi:hypothetical protein
MGWPPNEGQSSLLRGSCDACNVVVNLKTPATAFQSPLSILFCVGIFLTPASCVLTDPGSFCPGDNITLICNYTGGTLQQWIYRTDKAGIQILNLNVMPEEPIVPLTVDGVVFEPALLSTTPHLASQITFVANENMDGRMVECLNVGTSGSLDFDTTTLWVRSGSKCQGTWVASFPGSQFCNEKREDRGSSLLTSQCGGLCTPTSHHFLCLFDAKLVTVTSRSSTVSAW